MTSMTKTEQSIATQIMGMDRWAMIGQLLDFRGRVKMDFTQEFLAHQTNEWLRHILLAAYLHCR